MKTKGNRTQVFAGNPLMQPSVKSREHFQNVYDSAYVPYVSPERNRPDLRFVALGGATRKTPERPAVLRPGNRFARFLICAMVHSSQLALRVAAQWLFQARQGQ